MIVSYNLTEYLSCPNDYFGKTSEEEHQGTKLSNEFALRGFFAPTMPVLTNGPRLFETTPLKTCFELRSPSLDLGLIY